jgi:putative Flp pilus-assembly TadE/G-like protein
MRGWRSERGAYGLMFAVLLVVIVGLLGLAIDGGLVLVRYRQVRNANDAAALAAALSCANNEAAMANDRANTIADANAPGATLYGPGIEYPSGCTPNAPDGRAIVHYQATQTLYFSPLVGVSSPGTASARATGIWGGAGGSANVIPIAVYQDGLWASCDIDPSTDSYPAVGTPCVFWYDNDAQGDATWGFMAISTWPATPEENSSSTSGCSASGLDAIKSAIWPGYQGTLVMVGNPTYVCSENGAAIQPVANTLEDALAAGRDEFVMPVNDGDQMVLDNQGNPYRYAVVGFAHLKPVGIYKRNEPGYQACRDANPPVIPAGGDTANSYCFVATWQGFSTDGGILAGGGGNFGVLAVALAG